MALKRGNVSEAVVTPSFDIASEAGDPPAPAAEAVETVRAPIEGTVVANDDDAPFADQTAPPAPAAAAVKQAQQTSTAVAAHQSGGVITQAGKSGNMAEQMAANGMLGLNFGFGAFPSISLGTDGRFSSSEQVELGEAFSCVILHSKPKFICKNGLPDGDPNEDFFYSEYSPGENNHMPRVTTSNKDIDTILAEWKSKSWTPEWKPYLDVFVQMIDGHYDGELCVLSIPKTSITKLSGYTTTQWVQKNLLQHQYVTKVTVGNKITSSKFPFRPWTFKYDGPVVDA